jgi:RNA polymerase sigma factor (sigma-70 family)
MDKGQCENVDVLTNYSDEELFLLMSYKDENQIEAQKAFSIFYDRYKNFLWNLCYFICHNCKTNENNELAKDLFQNTMISIYTYGNTFDPQKSKVTTWMSRIAKSELYKLLCDIKEYRIDENLEVLLSESAANEEMETDFENQSPEQNALKEAIESLSEREQEVLLTYIMYEDGNKQLPLAIRQHLIDKYATTQQNIQQIKSRSLKKIKDHIVNHSKLSIIK